MHSSEFMNDEFNSKTVIVLFAGDRTNKNALNTEQCKLYHNMNILRVILGRHCTRASESRWVCVDGRD